MRADAECVLLHKCVDVHKCVMRKKRVVANVIMHNIITCKYLNTKAINLKLCHQTYYNYLKIYDGEEKLLCG